LLLEFLGVGYQEFLLVLVLLLIVVGPERMPQMAYQIGRAVREMQKYARAVRDEFSDEMGFIQEQYDTMKGEVDEARKSFREETQQFDREMRSVGKSVEEAVPEELKNPNKVIPISSGAASTARGAASSAKRETNPGANPPSSAEAAAAESSNEAAGTPSASPSKSKPSGDKPPLVF
jgi:sec-independent protein translocase protein TatB